MHPFLEEIDKLIKNYDKKKGRIRKFFGNNRSDYMDELIDQFKILKNYKSLTVNDLKWFYESYESTNYKYNSPQMNTSESGNVYREVKKMLDSSGTTVDGYKKLVEDAKNVASSSYEKKYKNVENAPSWQRNQAFTVEKALKTVEVNITYSPSAEAEKQAQKKAEQAGIVAQANIAYEKLVEKTEKEHAAKKQAEAEAKRQAIEKAKRDKEKAQESAKKAQEEAKRVEAKKQADIKKTEEEKQALITETTAELFAEIAFSAVKVQKGASLCPDLKSHTQAASDPAPLVPLDEESLYPVLPSAPLPQSQDKTSVFASAPLMTEKEELDFVLESSRRDALEEEAERTKEKIQLKYAEYLSRLDQEKAQANGTLVSLLDTNIPDLTGTTLLESAKVAPKTIAPTRAIPEAPQHSERSDLAANSLFAKQFPSAPTTTVAADLIDLSDFPSAPTTKVEAPEPKTAIGMK